MKVEVNCLFEVNDDRIRHASREVFPDDGENENRKRRCVKKAMADIVETVLRRHFKDDSGVDLTFVESGLSADDVLKFSGNAKLNNNNLPIRVHKLGSDEHLATQKDLDDMMKDLKRLERHSRSTTYFVVLHRT